MSENISGKTQAARAAAKLVESGMLIGLGTGTSASALIRELGARVRDEGLKILAVPTSVATAELAHSLGIPLRDIDDVGTVNIDFDGADEVDPEFQMIKGRGGALLREKIVACASEKRVILITPEKRVGQLGLAASVPVEVSPVGTRHIESRLRGLGAVTVLRHRADGSVFQTDGGNKIIDCQFPGITEPFDLDSRIQRIVGVYETGIFLGLCDILVVGYKDRVEWIEASRRDPRSSCV